MATVLKTWAFLAGAESWTWTTGSSDSTGAWDGAIGNPLGSLSDRIYGRNKGADTNYCQISGTWTDLFGVPAGTTVTGAQLTGGYAKCTVYNVAHNCTRGLVQIRDSADTTVVATLRAASSFTATDADWVATTGTNQSIGATYQPAATTVRVRWTDVLDTGNDGAAEVKNYFDGIGVTVTYVQHYTLSCATTSFAVTGTAAGLIRTYKFPAATTSAAVTGVIANLQKSHAPISAVVGSLVLTGAAVTLGATRYILGEAASCALTGIAAGLGSARNISMTGSSYSLAGIDADLVYYAVYVPPTYTLIAERAQQ